MAASARCALKLALCPGQAGDAPQGRALLKTLGKAPVADCALAMDRAYEGDETRQLASHLGFVPVVPPNPNRIAPWEYDRHLHKRRNEVQRLFRRLKGCRRVCTRYDKLDVIYLTFVHLALIFDALR